jgi:hypothetical protein
MAANAADVLQPGSTFKRGVADLEKTIEHKVRWNLNTPREDISPLGVGFPVYNLSFSHKAPFEYLSIYP